MAGSIANNAALYKKNAFTYVPPSPPAELMESTSYTLDFAARKFVHIGIDPSDKFQVVVHFLTPSRHVKITPDFLRRIFSLMGNILSFVLEQPVKYKRMLFLETEFYKLSSMMYSGENVLVMESKTLEGCRILLNRNDLIQLQYLEWCIFETVTRKSTITQPAVLKQFDMFLNYIDDEFTKVNSPPKTIHEMIAFIKNLRDDSIISSMPKNDVNIISQLKMYASSQLAEHWAQRWSGEMSPELFEELEVISPLSSPTPMSPPAIPDFFEQPSQILFPNEEEDPSQARGADEYRMLRDFSLNSTQTTWAPVRKTKPKDEEVNGQSWFPSPPSNAVDEKNGPTTFDHSPSILDFTGGKPTKKINKRNAKRKLFK